MAIVCAIGFIFLIGCFYDLLTAGISMSLGISPGIVFATTIITGFVLISLAIIGDVIVKAIKENKSAE